MKVALTGVTGLLGATVLRAVVADSHQVRLLVRDSDDRAFRGHPAEVVRGDIRSPDTLKPLVENCDVLIHSAAVISLNGDRDGSVSETNVQGTRNILTAAVNAGVRRVIHISSVHAYQQRPPDQPLDETRALIDHTGSSYDISKRNGQELALAFNNSRTEVIVLNPTGLIGPYDFKPSRAGQAILNIINNRFPFVTDGGFDFCDCRDVADTIVNAMTMGTPGECYILAGKWHSMHDIVAMLGVVLGRRIRTVHVPERILRLGLPLAYAWGKLLRTDPVFTAEAINALIHGSRDIRSNKAKAQLQYHQRPIEETIADTVAWFQSVGYVNRNRRTARTS